MPDTLFILIMEERKDMAFKIFARTLQGNIIPFLVDDYKVEDGFIVFIDHKFNQKKRFAQQNCEIVEL